MIDPEELTVKIILEEEYEIETITSFYDMQLNESNGSMTIDDASVFDILDQAASVSAVARRIVYAVVNPMVIGLGLILSSFALVTCLQSAAQSLGSARRDQKADSNTNETYGSRRGLRSLSLVYYYLALHLMCNIVYLIITGLSWSYFMVNSEHISAYNNFLCRVWQFFFRIFHELSLWMLIPPSWLSWSYMRKGYHSLCGRLSMSHVSAERAQSLLIKMDADGGSLRRGEMSSLNLVATASSAALTPPASASSSRARAPILAQLLVAVICSFVTLMHIHGIWSHSLSTEHYGADAKRCSTHRNTGVFFSRVWPLIRFALSTLAPTLLVATMVAMTTALGFRMRRFDRPTKPRSSTSASTSASASASASASSGMQGFLFWFNAHIGPTEVFATQFIAFWSILLRLQWCAVNLSTGFLMLQSPAVWNTRTERAVNLVLAVSQTADKCSTILGPLVFCLLRRTGADSAFCCPDRNRPRNRNRDRDTEGDCSLDLDCLPKCWSTIFDHKPSTVVELSQRPANK